MRDLLTRLGLAVVLVFVALLGGTVTSQYITAVRIVVTLIGAGFVLLWLIRAPREADVVDKLALGALLLFLVTCVTSQFPRQSLDAATSATAFVAALFVARRVVAQPAGREFALTVLGVLGIVVSVLFAVFWGASWARWISISGTLPPLDLVLPVGAYRHYQVVAMAVTALVPAVFVLARRPVIWPVAWIGLAAAAAVLVMSGTRTIWLAVAVVGLLLVGRGTIHPRRFISRLRLTPLALVGGAAVMVLLVVLAAPLAARLTTASTVELRGAIWGASLDSWLAHPVTGWGPGTFGSAISLSGFFDSYNSVGQHADDAPVQLLAESGLLGLGAAGLLMAALVAGRNRTAGPAPFAGLGLLAAMSITNNPTVYAHLVAIGLVWFALATPAVPTAAAAPSRRNGWVLVPTLAVGAVIAVVTSLTLAAAVAHDRARAAANDADASAVVAELRTARALDPGYAIYWRDSALWLLEQGELDAAALDIGRAVALNRADTTAWRIAAFVAMEAGDADSAMAFARRAEALRATDAVNPLMVAYVSSHFENAGASSEALQRALRHDPWLSGALDWQLAFPSDPTGMLTQAAASWTIDPDRSGRWLQARAWLGALSGRPVDPAVLGPIQAAASDTLTCSLESARTRLAGLSTSNASSPGGLLVRVLAGRALGESAEDAVLLTSLRWPIGHLMASQLLPGRSPLVEADEDLRLYGRFSLPAPQVGPLFPTPESGLSAWLVDPLAAADRGAPDSGLARCR